MMRSLRNLLRDCRGSIPIEGLFGGLLLLGWYAIAFQFYDAFRIRAMVTRATYTVGDLISREINAVGPTYMTGAKKLFDYVAYAQPANDTWLRITLISCEATDTDTRSCDGKTKQFRMDQSYATKASVDPHTTATINAEADRIPILAAGDSAVVMESSYLYWPIFSIGDKEIMLDGKTWTSQGLSSRLRFSNFVVTRPRGPRLTWNATK